MTRSRIRTATVAGVAALALAGLGGGVAWAETATPTSTATPSTQHGKHPGMHGEFTVQTKQGAQTRDFQRGTVTAANPTSVTVRSKDGFTATYAVDAQTKVRKDKQASQIGQVAVGDRVGLVAVKNGDALTARRLNDRGPAPAPAAPATPAPQPTG